MAMQVHVAFSDTFKAAGLMNGNPYSLGYDEATLNELNTSRERTHWKNKYEKEAKENAEAYAKKGEIDSLKHLKNSPVFIVSGERDEVVTPIQQEIAQGFYESYGANVKFVGDNRLGHRQALHYIPDILQHILKNLGKSFKKK